MPSLDDARRFALAMPQAIERTSWGNTAWAVAGVGKAAPRNFVWQRPFSKADVARDGEPPPGDLLAARVADVDEKSSLLLAEPGWMFTIQHFDGFPAVLVRLARVPLARLEEVVIDAWLSVAPRPVAQDWLAEHPLPGS